jgi:hypothetical protein
MEASAALRTPAPWSTGPGSFSAGRLFLADARLALLVLDHGRRLSLSRIFGVSGRQADVLSLVLALSAAEAAYRAARRVAGAPLAISGADVALGGLVLREGTLGIAGPGARAVPSAGTLLTIGILGGLAVPAVRRATHRLRAAEHRLRQERQRRYSAARRALGRNAAAGT